LQVFFRPARARNNPPQRGGLLCTAPKGQWFQVKRMKLKIGSLSVILNKLKGLVNFCIFANIF
jgi:hypothetical protein